MAFRLIPKEEKFFADFIALADRIVSGATLLEKMLATDPPAWEMAIEIKQVEEACDSVTHEIIQRLNRTFVTPIDREDIQRLSTELDDILDLLNSAARSCELYGVTSPTEPMTKLIGILVDCTRQLEAALPLLRAHDYTGLMATSRAIRQEEKKADTIYRAAISALFHEEGKNTKDLIRELAVLEHLEHAVDRCERVAHTLANLAVKHG